MPIRVNLPDGSIANFPDGTSPAEIEAALKGVDTSPPTTTPGANPELARLTGASAPDELARITPVPGRAAYAPTVGATVGGMLAAPLTGGASLVPAMIAAGLGGAGGAGLGLLVGAAGDAKVPGTAAGVLKTMGEQGAIQAGAEGAGRAIQAGLKAGAGRLYQSVLKPTVVARREFPGLVQTGLENAIPVSAWGAEKAGGLIQASKDAADQLVSTAAAQPGAPRINPQDAVAGIASAVKNVKGLPVARPQMKTIGDYARQYLAEHPGSIPLDKAQEAVRITDRFLDPAYRSAVDLGNPITAANTAAAMGINDETRQLLRQAVPGLAAQNATTQGLYGLQQAVTRRAGEQANRSVIGMQHLINAGLGAGAGAYGGKEKGLGTFAAMEFLTNPAVASRLAIGAQRAGGLPVSQAIRAAILAKLGVDAGSDPAGSHSPTP